MMKRSNAKNNAIVAIQIAIKNVNNKKLVNALLLAKLRKKDMLKDLWITS